MANNTSTLGSLIRIVRQRKGWTLREMSAVVGIPLSTLAKVETDKLSLTYDKLQQFTARLGLTMAEFLAEGETASGAAEAAPVMGRRSLTTTGNSVHIKTPNYDYEYLCADLRQKRMVPIITGSTPATSPNSARPFDTKARSSSSSWKGRSRCTCSSTRRSC